MSSVSVPAMTPTSRRRSSFWYGVSGYTIMLIGAFALFLWVRSMGESLIAPPAAPTVRPAGTAANPPVDLLFHLFATLIVIVLGGHLLGRVISWFGQPPVLGEVLAGIMLGPSLLGAISPETLHVLIPSREADPTGQVMTALKAIAQLGVVLYMFLVGLELNSAKLKHRAHAMIAISHASIVAPFVLGSLLSLWLYPMLSNDAVPFTSFALFMGVSLSVTAFPVLARILADRGWDHSPVGTAALGCAAADDVTAWCLLALVVGVARTQVSEALGVAAGAIAFIGFMFIVVKPLMARWCRSLDQRPLPNWVIPVVFAAVLGSALITEIIGIHAVFGAFLLGAMIPHDSHLAEQFTRKLKDLVLVLLLPAFFALTGLKTQIGLIAGWQNWMICLVIIAVATLGKLGGTYIASRWSGFDHSSSLAMGAMMNTRGLMGLIVLDVGLGLGVISPTLFAMMVIMALVTTMMTVPILNWCQRGKQLTTSSSP